MGPVELLLVLLGGPFGLPLSLPPLPEDPVLMRAAPAECLWYLSLSGMAKPDPASRNHLEQLLAEAEVQRFVTELEKRILARAKKDMPPEQLRAMEEAVRIGKVFASRPLTAFVASFDKADANMQGGAVINLGDEKQAVLQSLAFFEGLAGAPAAEGRWKRIPIPAPFPVEWGTEGNYLILGIGAGTAEAIAGRVAKPGAPPAWLTALKQELALEKPAQVSYFNVQKLLAIALADAPPQPRAALEAMGLLQVKQLAVGVGLDASGVVSRMRVTLEGDPQGIFAPLGAAPLTAADLAPLPADASLAAAWRLDGAKVLEHVRKVVARIEPQAAEEFDRNLGRIESELGLKLNEELLQPLGDVWRVYNSPAEGGVLFTGLTAVVSLRDRDKFAKTLERLTSMARAANPPDERGRRRRGGAVINEFPAGAHKGYLLSVADDDMPFSPAWCVTDRELVLSLYPQGVQSYVARQANRQASLTANPAVARLGDQGALAVFWHDVPATFRLLYPLLQFGGTMMTGELQREGFDLDVSLLPSAGAIHRHLLPETTALLKTPTGFMVESRGVSPSPTAALVLPLALSWVSHSRPLSGAVRAISHAADPASKSIENLKHIGLAMHNYESVYAKLPSSFDKNGKPGLSWRVHVLPFLEQQALYNQFRLDEAWDSPHNKQLIARMPEIYRAPGSKAAADFKTVYLTPSGKDTMFPPTGGINFAQIKDGTSNTVMCVEASDDRAVVWTRPDDLEIDAEKPLAGLLQRSNACVVLFGDGSVRRVSAKLPEGTWKALFTKAGGEVTGDLEP